MILITLSSPAVLPDLQDRGHLHRDRVRCLRGRWVCRWGRSVHSLFKLVTNDLRWAAGDISISYLFFLTFQQVRRTMLVSFLTICWCKDRYFFCYYQISNPLFCYRYLNFFLKKLQFFQDNLYLCNRNLKHLYIKGVLLSKRYKFENINQMTKWLWEKLHSD